MTRKRALWLILVVALLGVAFYLWGSSHTPPGQPALVSLTEANVADFEQNFNAAAGDTRIVLLVSPT